MPDYQSAFYAAVLLGLGVGLAALAIIELSEMLSNREDEDE